MSTEGVDVLSQVQPAKPRRAFPSPVTTLAIVTVLVWVAALFIPPGRYATDDDGSPIPGTYEQIASPLSFPERVQQLDLAPVNGIYGLLSPERGIVDTEAIGRLFGQIGVIVFIMSLGAFISISFSTRSLEVAVAALANRLRMGAMPLRIMRSGVPRIILPSTLSASPAVRNRCS